jgi:hypothetical protein
MSRKGIYILVLICALIILGLELSSTEKVRFKLMEYYFNRKNNKLAVEIGMKIVRKRSLTGPVDSEFKKAMGVKWRNAMTLLIEKEVTLVQEEWNSYRTFFNINSEITSRFERIRTFLAPSLPEGLNIARRYYKLVASMNPYSFEVGFLENDVNPEFGALGFNCSGGVALDCNLRSIGGNLGIKKSVAAIRLQRGVDETRVRPENLSVWISDDNKVYRRYTGSVSFSNETRATLLDHLDFSCQFLKIHCDFKDDKYTLAEDFKRILEIYGPPDFD